jgi:CRP/FNR family transcriptional regulator, cyclic AMP receptor protein
MSKQPVWDINLLKAFVLFDSISEEELQKIADLLHCKKFSAGSNIMTAEQPGEVVYFILQGTVKVHVEQADGSDVVISILGAGDIVGEMSLLDNSTRSASVVTIEESTLLWMDRNTFNELLKTVTALTYNLARILIKRLRLANEQIQALATQEVESRIAYHILVFTDQYGRVDANGDILIPIRLTQSDIASLVGASREHTNKVLVSYKERKYISVGQNHHITVHNKNALASRCR